MLNLRFDWDERKNSTNKQKHNVSFEEAQTAFHDDHGLLLPDPEGSDTDDRFILLGMSSSLRMLVVCHCYRERDEVIRIISARKANRFEQKQYESRWAR